jgi:hypothetical protein
MFRSWIRLIAAALANGDEKRATELERGAPLFIFLKRDHGALLQVTGRPRKALQYEIGNPHTASKMTRHRLPAGLYAPLRVILYEDETRGSIFEYDRPRPIMSRGAGFHADKASRQRLEELQHLAAPQLLTNDDLFSRVDARDLEHVLSDIQTDRGNLHVDGSLM